MVAAVALGFAMAIEAVYRVVPFTTIGKRKDWPGAVEAAPTADPIKLADVLLGAKSNNSRMLTGCPAAVVAVAQVVTTGLVPNRWAGSLEMVKVPFGGTITVCTWPVPESNGTDAACPA